MEQVPIKRIIEYLEKEDISVKYFGDIDLSVDGISTVLNYNKNTVTWIKSKEKYEKIRNRIKEEEIDFLVVDNDVDKIADFKNRFVCDNPKLVFNSIVREFFDVEDSLSLKGYNTFFGQDVQIEKDVSIGNNCTIGNTVSIGKGTKIYHNVVIGDRVIIGENCHIKSGAVIGEAGYGYCEKEHKFLGVPHLGTVIIENNVDIGANTCIDRGSLENTVIGEGSKIDNLCHIAHNVKIGKNVRVVAGAIIAGSAKLNDNVYIAPGGIVRNQIEVEKECIVGLGAVVVKNTVPKSVLTGIPARKTDIADNIEL